MKIDKNELAKKIGQLKGLYHQRLRARLLEVFFIKTGI